MKIRNLKIGVRLGLGFGLVVLMTAIDGFIDINEIENVLDNTGKMYRHPLVVSNAVRDIRANIMAMHRSMKDVALAMNNEQLDLAEAKIDENEKEVYNLFKVVFERFLGDKSDVEIAYDSFSDWKPIRDEVIQLVHNGEKDKASEITKGKGAKHVSYMNEKIQTMIDFANNKADSFYAAANKSKQRVIATHLLILTIIVSMSTFIAFFITRGITNPIGEMTEVSRKIEKGDYSVRNTINTTDETGFLARTINNMAASIQSHHAHLEEVVEKRTTELKKSNEQLRQEITERKLAEEQIKNQNILLEQAVQEKQDEMEVLMERLIRQERLAAIGQISGSITHELRNPLGAIKQSIFFLNRLHKNDKLASSSSKVQEHLELLSAEIDTSDRVISDLLQMTKVEPLKKEQTNLRNTISEAVERSHVKDGIQITIDLNPEPFMTWFDPLQMRQVIINLLTNSAQAISEKGLVTISAKMLNNNKKYHIEMQDNGYGIASKDLHKIFEPLFTTKAKGTGLGLSICKQIIENHGGKISISSQVKKGTTVKIELPTEQSIQKSN